MKNFETQRYTIAWLWRAVAWLVLLGGAKSNIDYDVAEFVWCNVLADFRGRGIGRLLTDYRLADIRAAGFKAVICGTMVPNIYMAYGFKILGTYDWAHGKTSLMLLTL